ncbi:MAG TPA: DUF1343 domain-containing protein [Agriterribacter sp.]|nr:DUF1343 domain-containing protein [Agriterribacter sp.]
MEHLRQGRIQAGATNLRRKFHIPSKREKKKKQLPFAMLNGVDHFIASRLFKKELRYALVSNHASFSAAGIPVAVALLRAGVPLVTLFSPEHGIGAQAEDGQRQNNSTDNLTQLPVVSLYGPHFAPTEKDLEDIDVTLFDLPNIGCRFYTYLWTLSYIMEACGKYRKKLIVLDRPNLLGVDMSMSEGPLLDEQHCSSFVGRWAIPLRYTLTYGEMALYWNDQKKLQVALEVIKAGDAIFNNTDDEKHSFFIPASPSMPTLQSAMLYPGTGLLEGINVNEGRGSSAPFQLLGAPWINGMDLHAYVNSLAIPGLACIPYSYMPMWGKYEKKLCHGLYMQVTDAAAFRPVSTGILLLSVLYDLYPQQLEAAPYPTFANPSGAQHLEKLAGTTAIWHWIKTNPAALKKQLPDLLDTAEWRNGVKKYLLYGR